MKIELILGQLPTNESNTNRGSLSTSHNSNSNTASRSGNNSVASIRRNGDIASASHSIGARFDEHSDGTTHFRPASRRCFHSSRST